MMGDLLPLVVTPITTPHVEGQEALLHEPWQIIVATFLTSLTGILGGIAAIIGARRSRHARDLAKAVADAMEQNIGQANGHGTLMKQTAQLMQNQHDIMQSQARDSSALTEHITSADTRLEQIHGRVSRVDNRLDAHIEESMSYRAGVENALGALADRLRLHDEWERSKKYPPEAEATPDPQPVRERAARRGQAKKGGTTT